MFYRFLTVSLIASTCLFAEESNTDTSKISETFGHMIGKNLKTLGIDLDMDLVFKGIKDQASGKSAPLSDEECRKAVLTYQATNNLKAAESFLKENAKNTEIIALEEGKVQYKVEKKGEGAKVESNFSPLVRYVGKYLDGTIFGQSREAEILSLEGAIPGFSKGLVGMQEGEKRTLYIHPELAYGTKGILPPNSLLTFEVEIVKANAVEENLPNSLIIEADSKAEPELDAPALR
ncbi:MAG: FKBP-type peptidyl-prolyl cis-trans isomerase [Verrucomicrobia bacterium]|nr:FKBP-type peptidyl-prolyl cis-trans isomerase [Verrucomicrobiota bacterium]